MADEDTPETQSVLGAKSDGGGAAADGGDAPAGSGAPQQAQGQPLELRDDDVEALYANLCRVSSTPEEVILDLALNPNPIGGGSGAITLKVSQRVILNHYTAKRLAALLMATVQRHEQAFGVLETDVRKRVKQQPQS